MKKLILFFALTTIIALSAFQCDPDYLTYFNIENATQAEITLTIEKIGKIIIPPGEIKLIHTEGDKRPPSVAYTYLYDPAVTINGSLVSDAFWRDEYWTEEYWIEKRSDRYCIYTLTLTDQLIETLLLPEN